MAGCCSRRMRPHPPPGLRRSTFLTAIGSRFSRRLICRCGSPPRGRAILSLRTPEVPDGNALIQRSGAAAGELGRLHCVQRRPKWRLTSHSQISRNKGFATSRTQPSALLPSRRRRRNSTSKSHRSTGRSDTMMSLSFSKHQMMRRLPRSP